MREWRRSPGWPAMGVPEDALDWIANLGSDRPPGRRGRLECVFSHGAMIADRKTMARNQRILAGKPILVAVIAQYIPYLAQLNAAVDQAQPLVGAALPRSVPPRRNIETGSRIAILAPQGHPATDVDALA